MKWINVKDKLPEYKLQIGGKKFVNVLMSDGEVVYDGDYTEDKFFVMGIPHNKITHWMYYPEPPQKAPVA